MKKAKKSKSRKARYSKTMVSKAIKRAKEVLRKRGVRGLMAEIERVLRKEGVIDKRGNIVLKRKVRRAGWRRKVCR